MANTWHRQFPYDHERPDEWLRTSPIGTYPPNGFGQGGSHLWAPDCCLRYRSAARQGEAVDTSTGHIGFRGSVRR
jgi:sulfatase modifying factor 1